MSLAVKASEDKDGWRTLIMDVDGFCKIMTESVKVAQQLQRKVFGFAANANDVFSAANTDPIFAPQKPLTNPP